MSYENNSIFWVETDRIEPNPYQPRKEFDEEKLNELAGSIRMYGILQPLTVTRKEVEREDGGLEVTYELIAGERRLRASRIAGLSQVPVIIRVGEESEREKLELAIIENLQREDLNPIDRARALKQLAEEFKLSHTEVAKKIGRSRVYVSNTLRLLALPEDILEAMRGGKLSEGHGRTLLMLNDRPEEQHTLYRETLLKKLSVREVEKISRKIAVDKVRKKDWDVDPELMELEKQLTEALGTRVQIEKKEFGGKLVIDYFSPEDIRKIADKLEHQFTQESDVQKASMNTEDQEDQQDQQAVPVQHPQSTDNLAQEPEHHVGDNETQNATSPVGTAPHTEQSEHKEAVMKEVTEEKVEPTEENAESKKDEDSDLYSLKNFSL